MTSGFQKWLKFTHSKVNVDQLQSWEQLVCHLFYFLLSNLSTALQLSSFFIIVFLSLWILRCANEKLAVPWLNWFNKICGWIVQNFFMHFNKFIKKHTLITKNCFNLLGCKLLFYPGAFNMTTGPAHWEPLIRAR